jgi:hypothetical protein
MKLDGFAVEVGPIRSSPRRRPAAAGAIIVAVVLLGLIGRLGWRSSDGDAGPDRDAPVAPALTTPASSRVARAPRPGLPQTCLYPMGWRVSSVESASGVVARVWRAAEPTAAAGPTDPGIDFIRIATERVTGVGWCAPATGSDQPPMSVKASLFRVVDQVAEPVDVMLLESVEPTPLGDLWGPRESPSNSAPRSWSNGRYAIRLATADGSWVRWLGLEIQIGVGSGFDAPAPGQRASGSL